jgi:IS30 family transposase
MTTLTGRPAMRSPGRPPVRRDVERAFWGKIAEGLTSEDAAITCGVSGPVGSRWFRERGGMPTIDLGPSSGRYLSFAEREEIALLRAQDVGVREIARRLRRSSSTISRELRRNAATRGGRLEYRAGIAQWKAELMARRPKTAKLVENDRLRDYVQDRLSGVIQRPNGTAAAGPVAPQWKGRNKPRRADRRWVTAWSPEQIAHRLPVDFPEDEAMPISHEAIYQALYVQGRGALKRELVTCLRTGRALRVPRSRARQRAQGHVTAEVMISERPAEADDRAIPGHWEGDLIIGTDRSAIGTLVERTTRFTMLLHLPRMAGYGIEPRVKNGPALAGYGAEAMRDAITATIGSEVLLGELPGAGLFPGQQPGRSLENRDLGPVAAQEQAQLHTDRASADQHHAAGKGMSSRSGGSATECRAGQRSGPAGATPRDRVGRSGGGCRDGRLGDRLLGGRLGDRARAPRWR